MARPTIIRTEQIVETARLLFLEHGYTLSTASIARKLNISEGSIFKRFKTKDALFAAAMGVPSKRTLPVNGWNALARPPYMMCCRTWDASLSSTYASRCRG